MSKRERKCHLSVVELPTQEYMAQHPYAWSGYQDLMYKKAVLEDVDPGAIPVINLDIVLALIGGFMLGWWLRGE